MKVKAFRGPCAFWATVAQGRSVVRGFGTLAWERKGLALLALATAVALFFLTWPHDAGLLRRLHFWNPAHEATARAVSSFLGTWGDFPTYNIPLALALWAYGFLTKSQAWRRIAIVCLLGAALAGLADDCLRLTAGRPRPDAHLPDGFYGIGYTFESRYQSFPSGHAASVLGAAMALLVVARPLGIAATLFALAVVWARMELYRHYPSDVLIGSLVGIYFGLMTGFGSRLRRPRPR